MVRKLALFVIPIILILSSCLNQGGLGDTSAAANDVDGANIVILSPNGGEDLLTKRSSSIVVSGTCDKKEVALKVEPSRPVVNECATKGTWSFETGRLYMGNNKFSVTGKVVSSSLGVNEMDGEVHVNNDGSGSEIDINLLVEEHRILVNKNPIEVDEEMKARAAFYDIDGVEVPVNPMHTKDRMFTWDVADNSIVSISSTTGDLIVLTGLLAGVTTLNCTVSMSGYLGEAMASKNDITVTGGPAPLTCAEIFANAQSALFIPDCPTASSSLDDYIAGDCDGDMMLYMMNFETYSAIGTCAMTCEQRQEFIYIYLNPMIRDLAKAGTQMNILASNSSCYDICVDTRAYYMSIPGVPPASECTAP